MPRRVTILRGISGSGKSTIARQMRGADDDVEIISADDYFVRPDGTYEFDAGLLSEAHGQALRLFIRRCQECVGHIVVDNTNTRLTEVAPYAAIAEAHGYEVFIITLECPPELAAQRNIHGVPLLALKVQAKRLHDDPTPTWWRGTTVPHPAPRYDATFWRGTMALDEEGG